MYYCSGKWWTLQTERLSSSQDNNCIIAMGKDHFLSREAVLFSEGPLLKVPISISELTLRGRSL